MDYQQFQTDFIAKRAKGLNFDRLIDVFLSEDEPKCIHKHLTELYFAVVEHIGADDAFPPTCGQPLSSAADHTGN